MQNGCQEMERAFMQAIEAPHVVLGAGAMGAATAYQLARRGQPVLLVEQFALGHNRGSSHGLARITRHSYADARYARLMPEAFRAWRELEADAGESFYYRTGGVSFSAPGSDYVGRVAASLSALEVPHRRMSGREWKQLHPVFAIPDDTDVVFEPDAGVLSAARAVSVQVNLAQARGGENTRVLTSSPVLRIDFDGEQPVLFTDSLCITAERLVITAGPWIGKILPELAPRFQTTRQTVAYLRPDEPSAYSIGRLPIFISMGTDPLDAFYGMPDFLGGGVKVARHGGPPCDPATADRTVHPVDLEPVRRFLRSCLPALAAAPLASSEVCLYTMAEGEEFVFGPLPGRPHTFIASPCSGHGFKFSCLIGRMLADWATTGTTPHGAEDWRTV
jgi:sarcosine oxidase